MYAILYKLCRCAHVCVLQPCGKVWVRMALLVGVRSSIMNNIGTEGCEAYVVFR